MLDGAFTTEKSVPPKRPAIRFTVSCGGHPPALLRRKGGAVEEFSHCIVAIGIVPNTETIGIEALATHHYDNRDIGAGCCKRPAATSLKLCSNSGATALEE